MRGRLFERVKILERKAAPLVPVETEEEYQAAGMAAEETVAWVLSSLTPQEAGNHVPKTREKARAIVAVINRVRARAGKVPVTEAEARLTFGEDGGEVEATAEETGEVLAIIEAELWARYGLKYLGPKPSQGDEIA